MQRRRVIVVAVAVLAAAGVVAAVVVLNRPHYTVPAHQVARPVSVSAELAYAQRYWQHPNTASFGDFGGTDCVNFTSQALLARGWTMTAQWGHTQSDGRNLYSSAWISSTALMHYLAARPQLATQMTDAQRDRVRPGDIAQFDWDRSGDRDHTAVVTAVTGSGADTRVFLDGHAPAWHDHSMDQVLHDHPHVAVYYWHLLR